VDTLGRAVVLRGEKRSTVDVAPADISPVVCSPTQTGPRRQPMMALASMRDPLKKGVTMNSTESKTRVTASVSVLLATLTSVSVGVATVLYLRSLTGR
jgi:hypothetical protein